MLSRFATTTKSSSSIALRSCCARSCELRLVRGAPFAFLTTVLPLLLGCEPPYVEVDCWLPVLRTEEPVAVLLHHGERGDRNSNYCPVPTPRVFRVDRPYGTVNFEWWGSPHRLYLSATSHDGRPLDIRGPEITVYRNTAGSWLAAYSHRRTFEGHNLLDPQPPTESITIEILDPEGQRLDTLQGTYEPLRCKCFVPDYVAGR